MFRWPDGTAYDPHVETGVGLTISIGIVAIAVVVCAAFAVWHPVKIARQRKHPHTMLIVVLSFLSATLLFLQSSVGGIAFWGVVICLSIWANCQPKRPAALSR